MKTFTKILMAIAAAAMLATGCVNEDPAYKKDTPGTNPDSDAKGYLALADMTMRVISETETKPDDTENETTQSSKTRVASDQPNVDEFIVEFFDADGKSVLKENYGDLKTSVAETGKLELAVGNYTMEIRSEEAASTPAAGWDHPVYYASRAFAIEKNKTTDIGEVTCTMSNIKVTLLYSKDLADKLTDNTQSTVTLGETVMNFAKNETRAAYFLPQAETNLLTFRLDGAFADTPDTPVRFSKNIPNVKAGQWRKITVVITYSDQGDIKLDIDVNDFVEDDEIVVEDPDNPGEPSFPTAPALVWPDHDLTKPFQLKATMFDADGNCTEPFAFSMTAANGIESFIVDISSDNTEFAGLLVAALGSPRIDLCTLDATQQPAYDLLSQLGFPLGNDLKGATSKTFDIASAMTLLYPAFTGTHVFAFEMTDTEGLQASAALTLVVNPASENSGPTIAWKDHNIDERYTITSDTKIEVDIAAEAGIKSLVVQIISEKLTPEELLTVGIPAIFDLCNVPGAGSNSPAQVAAVLKNFGFPVNDEVKNQTSLPTISITQFVPLLFGVANGCNNDFVLTVTDNAGKETTKTLQLYVPEP